MDSINIGGTFAITFWVFVVVIYALSAFFLWRKKKTSLIYFLSLIVINVFMWTQFMGRHNTFTYLVTYYLLPICLVTFGWLLYTKRNTD